MLKKLRKINQKIINKERRPVSDPENMPPEGNQVGRNGLS
jgi:hypothetical protein